MNWRVEYTEMKMLGEGSFGIVYQIKSKKNGNYYAVKEIKEHDKGAQNEIVILRSLSHSNIVRYIKHFFSVAELSIVMEFADAGTMTTFRATLHQNFDENSVQNVVNDLTSALVYLHEPRIMHRDLKPDNILCFRNGSNIPTFKIADFGIAKLLNQSAQARYYTSTWVGTPIYMAPEIIKGEEYTFSADMWSVGAIISFWCSGEHLFTNKASVVNFKPSMLSTQIKSSEVKDLVGKLLSETPRDRPTAENARSFEIKQNKHTDTMNSIFLITINILLKIGMVILPIGCIVLATIMLFDGIKHGLWLLIRYSEKL